MLDFRYHALSLVAVFLALTVGLLLGVAIGDRGLVSHAGHNVRESLRHDVSQARAQAQDLQTRLALHERFESQAISLLVTGRLQGERVGLIGIGALDNDVIANVHDALKETGARLTTVAAIREPVPAELVAQTPARGRGAGLHGARASAASAGTTTTAPDTASTTDDAPAVDPAAARRFGRAIGIDFMRGGAFLHSVSRTLLSSSSGDLGGLDAVVLVRAQPELDADVRTAANAFEDGLVAGLVAHNTPVVGVEATDADPSQIGWFTDRDLPSVDNVDQAFGQTALVFALGGANGAFGVKSTAEDLLPKTANSSG